MLTFFIPGLFALWFFCAFHLTTATPISTDHLQRRQSNLPAYVVEYGKGTTADGGGHNFQMVLLMNMAWEYAHRFVSAASRKRLLILQDYLTSLSSFTLALFS